MNDQTDKAAKKIAREKRICKKYIKEQLKLHINGHADGDINVIECPGCRGELEFEDDKWSHLSRGCNYAWIGSPPPGPEEIEALLEKKRQQARLDRAEQMCLLLCHGLYTKAISE